MVFKVQILRKNECVCDKGSLMETKTRLRETAELIPTYFLDGW